MIIETKYSIGDAVFLGTFESVEEHVTCPDCNGKKTWSVETAAGPVEVACETCKALFGDAGRGWITKRVLHPVTRKFTVGSVRFDSNEKKERRASYMCRETGVGSGSVCYEGDLHTLEGDAYQAALRKLAEHERFLKESEERARSEAAKRAVRAAKRKAAGEVKP